MSKEEASTPTEVERIGPHSGVDFAHAPVSALSAGHLAFPESAQPFSPSRVPAQFPNEASKSALLAHLDEVLKSHSFAPSRRSREFLSYIVRETVEGRGDSINERSIAYEVFGRGLNFEPGEDSLVRVKAREVRKRLAEYYESAGESPFYIEMPVGGYLPRILVAAPPAVPAAPQSRAEKIVAKPLNRRRFAWIVGGSLGLLGAASMVPLARLQQPPLDLLWKPIFATRTPLLIFIPILAERANGTISDRVGIGPAAALQRAADFLTRRDYPYRLRFGADLNYAQMREQPSLILGGFSSIWTLEMTRGLRFTFVDNQGSDRPSLEKPGLVTGQAVVDRQTGQMWQPVNPKPNGYADVDYGILCRLFDAASGQIVLLAGGITTFGTEAAGCVFFDPTSFAAVISHAPKNWETKNFQAVIRVPIIGTTPSSPEVIATYFW